MEFGATGELDELAVMAIDSGELYVGAIGYLAAAPPRLFRVATAGGTPEHLVTLGSPLLLADVDVTATTIWIAGRSTAPLGGFVATLDRTSPGTPTLFASFPSAPQLAVDGEQVFAVTSEGMFRLAP